MSHIGLRILADWLADDAAAGINALASEVPRDGADRAPKTVHVYDPTRHKFAARGRLPDPAVAGNAVEYPALVLVLLNITYDDGIPVLTPAGAMRSGELQVGAFLLLRDNDTELAAADAMYLIRAFTGSLILLDQSDDAARTRLGVRLSPSSAMQTSVVQEIPEDLLVPQCLTITYPFSEVVPVLTA